MIYLFRLHSSKCICHRFFFYVHTHPHACRHNHTHTARVIIRKDGSFLFIYPSTDLFTLLPDLCSEAHFEAACLKITSVHILFCFFSSVYFHKAHLQLNVCITSQIYLLSIDSSFSGAFWWGESGNWIQSSWQRLQSLGLSSLSFLYFFLVLLKCSKKKTNASINNLLGTYTNLPLLEPKAEHLLLHY